MLNGGRQFPQTSPVSAVQFVNGQQQPGAMEGKMIGERRELSTQVWAVLCSGGLPGEAAQLEREGDRGHLPSARLTAPAWWRLPGVDAT